MKDERRKQTEQKFIKFGKAEFLEKGYVKANLRDICKAAGTKVSVRKSIGRCERRSLVILQNLWEAARIQKEVYRK